MRLERYVAVSHGRWRMTCWVTSLPIGRAGIKGLWSQHVGCYNCIARLIPACSSGASEESRLVWACLMVINLCHSVMSKSLQWTSRALWYVAFPLLFTNQDDRMPPL